MLRIEGVDPMVGACRRREVGSADRRRGSRYACDVGISCRDGQRSFRGRILDVSPGGARLWFSERVRQGLPVDLAAGSAERLTGKVVWLRRSGEGFEGGVRFEEPGAGFHRTAGQAGLLSERPVRARRQTERVVARLPVRILELEQGLSGTGFTSDLSLGGARVCTEVRLQTGDRVVLRIGPLEHLAPVALTGRVLEARLRPSRGRGDWICRIEFQHLSPHVALMVASILGHLRRQESRPSLERR
ncbi:MAG: PilZ domain-containing protein [Armatimonadetes bacterium]|nr:PilZ domain-containing protein [Armatimonadota bacterium]